MQVENVTVECMEWGRTFCRTNDRRDVSAWLREQCQLKNREVLCNVASARSGSVAGGH